MDFLNYNELTSNSDAFLEIEDFECFYELESSLIVYANRLSRSQYTLGTTDNFDHNNLLENEVITVPKNFLRLNSFNKKSESFDLISYNEQSNLIYPENESNNINYEPEIFATEESKQFLMMLSKSTITNENSEIKYSRFDLKDRYFSLNKNNNVESFDINLNQQESQVEKIEKVVEKVKQISVQNTIENKKINYKFETSKFEQKNSSYVTNNNVNNLIEPQVTTTDLEVLKKDMKLTIREEINKNTEKTLKESEAISKRIVADEFSKFLR